MAKSSSKAGSRTTPAIRNRIKEHRRVRAGDLVPHEMNFRRHPDGQKAALRGVYEEVGFARSLLAFEMPDGRLKLIDGHLRQEIDPEMQVYVEILDVTESEAKLLLATMDPLAALADTDAGAFGELLAGLQPESAALGDYLLGLKEAHPVVPALPEPGAGGDEFDGAPAEGPTRCQPGDLWVIGGKHRLLVGDCTDAANVERLMGGEKAEMVWTDPPYGVSIGDKNKFLNSIAPCNRIEENLQNDSLDEAGLSAMLKGSFEAAAKNCLAGAAWYVAAPAGPTHLLFGQALKDLGIWRQTIQWVKNNATFSPMGVSYHWKAEPIFYGWLPNGGHRYHGDRKQTTVWEIDRPMAPPDHPTMKPVELVGRAIEHSSLAEEIVLDPFLGSGTTMIAAHRLGRRAFGCELEPKYGDVILKRAEAEGLSVEKA